MLFKFIDIKEVHSENILLISLTKEVLKLLKSNVFNELHVQNIDDMLITEEVLNLFKSNEVIELHPKNIEFHFFNF